MISTVKDRRKREPLSGIDGSWRSFYSGPDYPADPRHFMEIGNGSPLSKMSSFHSA
jgi:hypothetical protein